jgi:Zn-dependent metalloprotease
MNRSCYCLNCITPPHLLKKLLESKDRDIREAAYNTLLATARLRGERSVRALTFAGAPAAGRRTIFDCRNSIVLPSAVVARTEDGEPSSDQAVNRSFDGLGGTREFYRTVFDRNSIDNRGMRLDGFVHRGVRFNNAFWDGQEMVFGDGDGVIFTDFTKSLDVIAHELTHGVTEFTANLDYHNQSGALNESMSDVFGSLVKQWSLDQTADVADWLIGAEVITPAIEADALRSMKAPGTAYDNELLGKDPQPDHMDRFVVLPDTDEGDNGGVHINSGIPNKAFQLTAVGIGGFAWEAPGHIWYESLLASNQFTDFQEFATTTFVKAGELYGANSVEQQAVASAWREVGIRIPGAPTGARSRGPSRGRGGEAGREPEPSKHTDTLVALTKRVEALAAQLKTLAKDVNTLKEKK